VDPGLIPGEGPRLAAVHFGGSAVRRHLRLNLRPLGYERIRASHSSRPSSQAVSKQGRNACTDAGVGPFGRAFTDRRRRGVCVPKSASSGRSANASDCSLWRYTGPLIPRPVAPDRLSVLSAIVGT
jgi:hypothetical protein